MTAATDDQTFGTADDVLVRLFSDPAVRAEPYPAYRQLRESAPVHHSAVLPLWVNGIAPTEVTVGTM